MTRWALASVIFALAGCAATMPPPLPSKGGPRWIELSSDHFTLWTDLPDDEAHERIRDLLLAGSLPHDDSVEATKELCELTAEDPGIHLPGGLCPAPPSTN